MNKKRFLSIIVVAVLTVGSLGMLVTANAEVGKHATEVPTGYIAISNKTDLLDMMNYGIENVNVEKTNNYILMNDIAFESSDFEEGGAFYNDGKAWAPLGIMASYPYSGTFDGNGYTISGLVVNNNVYNEEGNCGFIGVNAGVVKNLHVKDSTMEINTGAEPNLTYASAYGGGIVGVNLEEGIVENCSTTGTSIISRSTTVNAYAGGIVGYNSGIIKNCFVANSNIKAITLSDRVDRTDKAIVGGISGSNLNATMWNVMVTNDVTLSVETAITLAGNTATGSIVGTNNATAKLVGAYYPEGSEFVGTGSVTKAVGIPLANEQYTRVDYFGSFDFTNIWEMGEEHPVLRINGTSEAVAPEVTAKVELPEATPTPTTPITTATTEPTATVEPTPISQKTGNIIRFKKKSIKIKRGKKVVLKLTGKMIKKAKFSVGKGKKVVKLIKKKAKQVTVKGIKKGKATVVAKSAGKQAVCKITVKK